MIPARAGVALASAALALAVAIPATAQEPAPPAPPVPDAAELRTYAEAHLDIAEITTAIDEAVATAATEEEKAQIRTEGESQVAAVLETRQIAAERYDEISNLLLADPELQAQFEEIRAQVEEERKGGG
jgi:hypothetical protein